MTVPVPPVLVGSVFTLLDSQEAMLIAYGSSLLQVNPNSLNPEVASSATYQFDFQSPDAVKTLERLLVRYERIGGCTLKITYSAISPENQAPVVVTRVLDAQTDGLLRNVLFDGAIAGDIIQVTFSIAANGGPFSMTLFAPYIDTRGEIIEAT